MTDYNEIIDYSVILSQTLSNEGTFKTLLFMAEIDDAETGVTWPAGQLYKDYTDTVGVNADFPEGHRVRLAATAWAKQVPRAKTFRVGQFNPLNPVADQIDAIPDDWVIGTGLQGSYGVDFSDWNEARKNKKIIFIADADIQANEALHPFKIIYDSGNRFTIPTRCRGAGTILTNVSIAVVNNAATITSDGGAPHNVKVGEKVYHKDSTIAELNGYQTVTAVPGTDSYSVACETADTTEITGETICDCGYDGYMETGLASMALGYEPGEIALAHKTVIGAAKVTTKEELESNQADLEAVNANWYREIDKKMYWNGLSSGNKYFDTLFGLAIWFPWYLQKSLFSFITSGKKRSFSDATFLGALNLMNQACGEAVERGLTDSFTQDFENFPGTGYPPGAIAGDNYVNRVPKKTDFTPAERTDRRLKKGGFVTYIQASGGVHGFILGINIVE